MIGANTDLRTREFRGWEIKLQTLAIRQPSTFIVALSLPNSSLTKVEDSLIRGSVANKST